MREVQFPVAASDVLVKTIDSFPLDPPAVERAEMVVGSVPRRRIKAGEAILANWLKLPNDVERGDPISVEVLGRRARLLDILFRPPFAFLRSYVLKLGFLEGLPGLAAAVGIVRQHGGTLKLSSRLGQGTRFRILFPLEAEDPLQSRLYLLDEPVVQCLVQVEVG